VLGVLLECLSPLDVFPYRCRKESKEQRDKYRVFLYVCEDERGYMVSVVLGGLSMCRECVCAWVCVCNVVLCISSQGSGMLVSTHIHRMRE